MNKELEEINELYNKGCAAKLEAIKNENIEKFKIAAEFHKRAAEKYAELLANTASTEVNFITQVKTFRAYYLFESAECFYAYEYKNEHFDKAIKLAASAKSHIESAIGIIDDNYNLLNEKTKLFLRKQKDNFTLCLHTIPIKEIEPVAKKAMKVKDYIAALDSYRMMNDLQDIVYNYVINSSLEEVYKRTEKGNYYASKSSIAMSLAGVYHDRSTGNEYDKELLEQFLEALKYIKKAQNINPEQKKYKQGADATINNIKVILLKNKNSWLAYLIEFKNDKNLKSIMQQTDNEYFKRQNAKLELENDKFKKLILTFGLYFSAFLGLGYFLWQISLSEISWFRLILIMLCLPLFFIIIGAFALRSTDSLKEENFMKLMELAIKTNLKGLKFLAEKKEA